MAEETTAGEKSKSIQAVELVRAVFESIYGGLGLIRFSVIELTPLNGTNGKDSKRWKVACRFYESVDSREPSNFEAEVNLEDSIVTIKKVGEKEETKKQYRVNLA